MLLGEVEIPRRTFERVAAVCREFESAEFKQLINRRRSEWINRSLCKLIQEEAEPCFLLPHVLDFIERVEKGGFLEHYSVNSFELWLNQFSGLSDEENYRIRGKIAGKWIDRGDYQELFPIGMGKVYEGTHFVTAHRSPDLDTTVASFWGWLDAFAARVGDSLHVWNLPGGPPLSQIETDLIFRDVLGPAVFTHLPKTRTALTLTGNDLMTQKGFTRKRLDEPSAGIDHERNRVAVVLVDRDGFYLGDWRHFDVEGVRQVVLLLSSCLRWFENALHLKVISLFAKPDLRQGDVERLVEESFREPIGECEPAREFSSRQQEEVAAFLEKVLRVPGGLNAAFEEVGKALSGLADIPFKGSRALLKDLRLEGLFRGEKGALVEDRSQIFHFLEKGIGRLHDALFKIRTRLETLDIAFSTKVEVFGHRPTFVSVRSDVEEIRAKMGSYPYLTVAYPDEGRYFPVGIIQAADLRKPVLGTVSLRDFCNRDEMGIPAYLEVISVIDHHKSSLATFAPPLAQIADAQSSNTLVARSAFVINDRYSTLGKSEKEIDREIGSAKASPRLMQRLWLRKRAAAAVGPYYVHPEREMLEYFHFLYAIIDDTDLLSKVTPLDVEVAAELLNRLKSLAGKKEVEIVSLDDIPRDKHFARKAAARILQNADMHSLYSKVYTYREKEVNHNLQLAAAHKPSNTFADTKEQNGCCRVGQTKVFANNIPLFEEKADAIREMWLLSAQAACQEKPEVDLHIHMVSTIVGADEVYRGEAAKYPHQDEMWLWIPGTDSSVERLKRFLTAFQKSPGLKGQALEVEFLGDNGEELATLFHESFPEAAQKRRKKSAPLLPIAVLRFQAGSLNSRKAMVSPFLPTV
jgi:hypothetical protein